MIYRALDFNFTVTADEPLHRSLLAALSPLAVAEGTIGSDSRGHAASVPEIVVTMSDREWTISEGRDHLRATSIGIALARVLEFVNQRAAASLRSAIPFHAAAVAIPSNGVIALAGSSGSGKSTLGTAALRSGWGFVAEEITAVDPTSLAVRPFHRPIGLRRGGAEALGIDYPDDAVHQEVYPWPSPVAARRQAGSLIGIALVSRCAHPNGISPIRPALALAELIEHCVVPSDDRITDVFQQVDSIVRRIPVVRLSYRSPAEGLLYLNQLADTWA